MSTQWLEVFKHSVHGGIHAKGCKFCGVRWKVYQRFPGHNPGCKMRELPMSVAHEIAKVDYPHFISCRGCRSERRCCQCGTKENWSQHCVNGRCPVCCSIQCDHYGRRAKVNQV